MNRNCRAPLSPHEVAALRRLRSDSRDPIWSSHRRLFLSMNLVVVGIDELKITDAGRNRLTMDEASDALFDRRPTRPAPRFG